MMLSCVPEQRMVYGGLHDWSGNALACVRPK